ncbi:MAG: adenosine kinase, partial [Waterburya sp.]
MTKYDVYALGNALLDIEFEVSPETLENLGIDKGVMTLLDQ